MYESDASRRRACCTEQSKALRHLTYMMAGTRLSELLLPLVMLMDDALQAAQLIGMLIPTRQGYWFWPSLELCPVVDVG